MLNTDPDPGFFDDQILKKKKILAEKNLSVFSLGRIRIKLSRSNRIAGGCAGAGVRWLGGPEYLLPGLRGSGGRQRGQNRRTLRHF